MSHLIEQWNFNSTPAIQVQQPDSRIEPNHWYHCQRDAPGLKQWLTQNQVPAGLIDSILAEETRPTFEQYDGENFVLILRGINMNENSSPEDMLSIRLLYFNGALISTRKTPSKAVSTVREKLAAHTGPNNLHSLIQQIIDGLNTNLDRFLATLEARIEQFDSLTSLTEEVVSTHKALLKTKRFIRPQLYAIKDYRLSNSELAQASEERLKHSVNTVTRINENIEFYIGELDLIANELRHFHSEKMNQNTYLFSIVAAIFLPTSFLTGLLGINIGGMPGVEDPQAFWLFSGGILGIFVLELFILNRLGFFSQRGK
ncbi:CorA family divalent cation transporter [Vibrio sp.]|uniref:CorA family divalent cation transporter n=1 Tax=Vibrio sp. TaxID=678 RepID=UPI003D10D897